MGHDVHFLQRLERYSPPHVDLAMSLYHDPELMRGLLTHHKVPDGAERVAIAMTDEPNGPRIVVQRNGRFITALGDGMLSDLPVVSRAALDAAISKREAFRALLEEAKRVAGPTGISGKVLARVARAGQWLSREEVASLLVWTQMGGSIHKLYSEVLHGVVTLRKDLQKGCRTRNIPKLAASKQQLWEFIWAMAHLNGVLAHSARKDVQTLGEEFAVRSHRFLCGDEIIPLTMRATWAATRTPKLILPELRRRWADPYNYGDLRALWMAAATIANGQSKLRAQIEKMIQRAPGADTWEKDPQLGKAWKVIEETVRLEFGTAFHDPESAIRFHKLIGQEIAIELGRKLPADSKWKFERPEDVPDEIAAGTLLLMPYEDDLESDEAMSLAWTPAWLGKASLEETYLPADYLKAVKFDFDPTVVDRMLQRANDRSESKTLKYDGPRIGRNDPCPCDSGKKFKRCCLAA